MANWSKQINRKRLYQALGVTNSDKLPADFQGTFPLVTVYNRSLDAEPFAQLTIEVDATKPPKNGRKSSQHRTFVLCACGRRVPTGRYHQHKCY